MKHLGKKIWATLGITGLLAVILFGNLIYMNLRPADPLVAGWQDYNPARFEALQASGQPFLVEIYASWCPTCLLQTRALETLAEEGRAPKIAAVRVDFDRDIEFIKSHEFQGTGLMVIYRHGQEVARGSGLVTPDKILAFLNENGIR